MDRVIRTVPLSRVSRFFALSKSQHPISEWITVTVGNPHQEKFPVPRPAQTRHTY